MGIPAILRLQWMCGRKTENHLQGRQVCPADLPINLRWSCAVLNDSVAQWFLRFRKSGQHLPSTSSESDERGASLCFLPPVPQDISSAFTQPRLRWIPGGIGVEIRFSFSALQPHGLEESTLVKIPTVYGDDWGMVYQVYHCYTHINRLDVI